MNILILHDCRGFLAGSLLQNSGRKVDIAQIKKRLEKLGCQVEVRLIHSLSFPSKYKGWYVVYPSSEDSGLFYKSYIEDYVLRLQLDGAILLPRFELFRAHHNKVFMEMMRTTLSKDYQTIQSKYLYSVDDLKQFNQIEFPLVVKTSEGSGSSGVALANNWDELTKKVQKLGKITCFSNGNNIKNHIREKVRAFLIIRKNYDRLPHVNTKQKMIVQTFIPNLHEDYKVLVFNEKFYLLRRKVRDNDFRASGSGKLSFITNIGDTEKQILDYARHAYIQLNTPLLSIDIAYDGKSCHMVEFQCIMFGPYTLQFSKWYYEYNNCTWEQKSKESILENEMANAYVGFINVNFLKN